MSSKRRIKLTVAYDGTHYHGWQFQPGSPTIEGELNKHLSELFKEDIVPDKYHLYKVGSVSGIQEAGHVRADIFGNNYEWLHISGIAEVLPMDSCDVYLSMKFAGEHYGGSKEVQEAVYLDRAIVVRR